MRFTPASRHRSTWWRAPSTSVAPPRLTPPAPPNVIVPSVSADTRRPLRPSCRYSTSFTFRPSVTEIQPMTPGACRGRGPRAKAKPRCADGHAFRRPFTGRRPAVNSIIEGRSLRAHVDGGMCGPMYVPPNRTEQDRAPTNTPPPASRARRDGDRGIRRGVPAAERQAGTGRRPIQRRQPPRHQARGDPHAGEPLLRPLLRDAAQRARVL